MLAIATEQHRLKMANPYPIQIQRPEEPYHPRDALKGSISAAGMGFGAGFVASAVQNSLAKRNVGAMGVFTRTGSTIATFTIVPAVYSFTKDATANLRETDDTLNTSVGAFVAGATMALRTGRMPAILGWGAGLSIVLSALDFTGGLRGKKQQTEFADEYERKEYLRTNRRRPLTETIAEIGEARGIEPPGYQERRQERLKEKYGVEINTVPATAQ